MKNKSATIASMTKIRIEGLKSIDISLRECFNDDKIQIIGFTIHHEMTNSSFFFPFFHPLRVKTSTQERTKSALLKNGGTEIEEHERLKRIKIFFSDRSLRKIAHLASRNRTPVEISSGFKGISSKVSGVFGWP